MKLNKKIIICSIIAVLVVVGVIALIIPTKHKTVISVEQLGNIKSYIRTQNYIEDLDEIDRFDVLQLFGIDSFSIPNSLFFTSEMPINSETEETEYPDSMFIMVLREDSTSFDESYYLINGMIDAVINRSNNDKLINNYKNTIKVKTDDYYYFIVGDNNKELESEILNHI